LVPKKKENKKEQLSQCYQEQKEFGFLPCAWLFL